MNASESSSPDIAESVKELICSVLDIPLSSYSTNLGINKHPFWDSLSHVHILLSLEKRFGLTISDAMYEHTQTVKDITAYLEDHLSDGTHD
jgi:acyl carrier protein